MKHQFKFILILIFVSIPLLGWCQTYELRGTLTDQNREERLGFVQVALFESETAADPVTYTDTDEEGQFMLEASKGKYVLKAFFIGYQDLVVKDIQIDGNTSLGELNM